MDLISRKAALELLGEPHPLDHTAIADVQKIIALPAVHAVPLDRLCEWLSESSINIPCTSCKNFVNEYCTAIGDKSEPCPNSADGWRRAITEWMEEQDAQTDQPGK